MSLFGRVLSLVWVVAALVGFTSSAQAAQTPSEVVKEYYAALEATMKEGPALGFDGRYKKLEPAVTKAFNLPLMARYAVGPSWASASPEDQQKLVAAFSKFSVSTYASRFAKYDGEVFTVQSEKPMASGQGIMVTTQLAPKGEAPVTLNYLVRADEKGELRIADVYLDASISELATRRAEFTSVIKREGFAALIASLEAKSVKMAEAKAKDK